MARAKVRYVSSILQNGLKLPQHIGLKWYGIYFADRVVKSLSYCDYSTAGRSQHLFLCDVLFDKVYKTKCLAKSAPSGSQSVKGKGYRIPDQAWNMKIDVFTWPLGPSVNANGNHISFNEYIVYDQTQVQPKYLIKFKYSTEKVTYNMY